jgi:Tfp pilus assembly protein PilO
MGKDIEDQRIDLEKKYIKGYTLKQLTENLKKIEPKLNQLDRIFINKNQELEFITTLENEADRAGVNQKINLASPQSAVNQKFQKNGLQLSSQGGFNQQLKYLMNLEALSYYININLIELTPANGPATAAVSSQPNSPSDQTSRINMLINADTYWE